MPVGLGVVNNPAAPDKDFRLCIERPVVGEDPSQFGDLDDRRAVVTGSSSGIGRAIAVELARAGADVVVHGRTETAALRETADLIRQRNRRAAIVVGDFEREEELARFASEAWNAWNGIDIVVNNAGVDLLTGPAAKWDHVTKLENLWAVDVRGTVQLSKSLGGRMKAAGRGVVLNIGWDQADRGMEGDSGELFAAAKNAIMGFTRSLSVSLAPEVRVNCIAPGWIRTAWGEQAGDTWQQRVLRETPLRRWGTPNDVARLARFLVSDDAGYITGQVICANGGAVR
jgi:3-oxoacyl-[acyl-carrier protein] reductase